MQRLNEILLEHPGDSPVYVQLEGAEKTTVLQLGDEHLVDDRNGLSPSSASCSAPTASCRPRR